MTYIINTNYMVMAIRGEKSSGTGIGKVLQYRPLFGSADRRVAGDKGYKSSRKVRTITLKK
jgi:hypothetical protein